jgi:hypothetical protein
MALTGPEQPLHRSGTALLLFRAGEDTPKAVPLSLVARLEDLPAGRIERPADSRWCSIAAS